LDEVREADILLHVVDVSHPQYEDQYAVVNKTLQELKCFDKPTITIFNKSDQYEKNTFDEWLSEDVKQEILNDLKLKWERETHGNCIFISATEKKNIDKLRKIMVNKIRDTYQVRYPYKAEFFY
jgi:GTP-binding protein HflX